MTSPTATAALERAVRRYARAPLLVRAHVHGRAFLSDLTTVEGHVPRDGFIVDLGCGHGLFANLLVETSDRRRVLGIDVDERKIPVARSTIQGRNELAFEVGDAVESPPPRCDAVTIVDVLCLLTFEEQRRILRNAASALPEGGPLILKSQERQSSARFLLTYVEEVIAVNAGVTRGARRGLYFTSRAEAQEMLHDAGFAVDVVEMRDRIYTDVIYLARKRTGAP